MDGAKLPGSQEPREAPRRAWRQPLHERETDRVRLDGKPAVRCVEHGEVAAGRQHAIVLVHLRAPGTLGQVLDDAEGEYEVERAIAPGQRARLVVRESLHLDQRLQI